MFDLFTIKPQRCSVPFLHRPAVSICTEVMSIHYTYTHSPPLSSSSLVGVLFVVMTHLLDLLLTFSLECPHKIMHISLSVALSISESGPSPPINVSFLKQFTWRSLSVTVLLAALIILELYQGSQHHFRLYSAYSKEPGLDYVSISCTSYYWQII